MDMSYMNLQPQSTPDCTRGSEMLTITELGMFIETQKALKQSEKEQGKVDRKIKFLKELSGNLDRQQRMLSEKIQYYEKRDTSMF